MAMEEAGLFSPRKGFGVSGRQADEVNQGFTALHKQELQP